MKTLLEIVLALLAAAGLLSLGWLIFGRLLSPVGKGRVYAVLPAWGDGEALEYGVAGLKWLEGGGLARFPIVVADAGLSQVGLALAQALVEQYPGLTICPLDRLPEFLAGQRDR